MVQPLDAIVAALDISKSSSNNPVVTDLPLAVDGTIDMSMLTSTKSFTDCLAHFATIMNKSDDELKHENNRSLNVAMTRLTWNTKLTKQRKEDKKTQQLSDLEQLELCAKKKEIPGRSNIAPQKNEDLQRNGMIYGMVKVRPIMS